MKKAKGVFTLSGTDAEWGTVRIDWKSGQLYLYVQKALSERFALNGERSLICYCEGNILVLIKPRGLEHVHKAIADAQTTYSKLRQQERELEEQTKEREKISLE